MSTSQIYLVEAICTVIILSSALFGAFFYYRKTLCDSLTEFGALALVIALGGICLPPLLWCLAMANSWGSLEQPEVSGTGGGVYGLQYENYPVVAFYYCLHAYALFGLALSLALFPVSTFRGAIYSRRGRIADAFSLVRSLVGQMRALEIVLLAVVFALVVIYYTICGWNTLWYSNSGRFEGFAAGHYSFLAPVVRVIPIGLLFSGLAAAGMFLMGRLPVLNLLTVFLACLPFVSTASRSFSLILFVLYAVLLFKYRSNKIIWAGVALAPFILVYLLLIPLSLRGMSYVGLFALIEAHGALWDAASNPGGVIGLLATASANLSQGFAIMVEVFDLRKVGPVADDVPFGYWWRSFSPTFSVMDGFSSDWLQYNPRINQFTPFNAIAELYAFSAWVSPIFFSFIYYIWIRLIGLMARAGGFCFIFAFLSFPIVALSLMQFQQYQIRTFTRFVYVGYFISVLILFVRASVPQLGNWVKPRRRAKMNKAEVLSDRVL